MMSKSAKSLVLFIIVSFFLPLMMVAIQAKISDNAIGFVFYGIQAAAPSISAIVVFAVNRELRISFSRLFRKDHLGMAILLPVAIVCVVMVTARILSSQITGELSSFWGTISYRQWVIILWAIVAEELGWRGYLEPALNKLIVNKQIVPGIVGLIWCLWHYHYFIQNSIEVPVALFLTGCIIESYICSYLMRITKDNLVSAMAFHFMYNLMIHAVAINPSDNNGSIIPYVTMTILEALVMFILIIWDTKVKKSSRKKELR
ncbi:MAG: CPBP family intramembrane metalloprotease [Clostridia bacterium]|nr:CPBP family intramembrane metalloprotease [Clostridia bacterium]